MHVGQHDMSHQCQLTLNTRGAVFTYLRWLRLTLRAYPRLTLPSRHSRPALGRWLMTSQSAWARASERCAVAIGTAGRPSSPFFCHSVRNRALEDPLTSALGRLMPLAK